MGYMTTEELGGLRNAAHAHALRASTLADRSDQLVAEFEDLPSNQWDGRNTDAMFCRVQAETHAAVAQACAAAAIAGADRSL